MSDACIGGANVGYVQCGQYKWSARTNNLIDVLDEKSIVRLITTGEVDVCMEEMGHLISACHHFVRENRKDASVAVGLPFHISFLLGARSALRRV